MVAGVLQGGLADKDLTKNVSLDEGYVFCVPSTPRTIIPFTYADEGQACV